MLKANFKIKNNKKDKKEEPSLKIDEKISESDFTDLWSFRSKKRQKLK